MDGWVVPWTVTGVLVVVLLVGLMNKVSTVSFSVKHEREAHHETSNNTFVAGPVQRGSG